MGADHSIEKVVLFDGLCNLCSTSVQFILKRNSKGNLKFASLQSDFGNGLLNRLKVENNLKTVIYFNQGKLFTKSDAVLEIAKELNGLWPIFHAFKVTPKFLRDFIYDVVAKYRYQWFGKRNECWLPTPELQCRFIS